MGGIEFTLDANGQPRFLCIDKGGEKVNVGSKLEDFQVVRPLGKGHFGAVYLVTSKLTNKLYAMKEIQTKNYKTPLDKGYDEGRERKTTSLPEGHRSTTTRETWQLPIL